MGRLGPRHRTPFFVSSPPLLPLQGKGWRCRLGPKWGHRGSSRYEIGLGGDRSVCPDLSLQDSGATPGGQDGRGASTWPVVRSSSNSTWMRTGQHGHSASRQGRAAQQKAWVPLGPQTALSTGPLPGTGFWQRVSAVPLQRCHPGHSTVAMAGLPLTPVPRAPQHRSRVQLWLGAEGGGVQGPGQVPRQPWERMPAARTSLTG